VLLQAHTPTLVLDQDAGVDQDAHGSRTSIAESIDLAEARSLANSSASASDNLGREASRPGSSARRFPAGKGPKLGDRLVAAHEHEALAAIDHPVDVVGKVPRDLRDGTSLVHIQFPQLSI
jgi:hypothetical protein